MRSFPAPSTSYSVGTEDVCSLKQSRRIAQCRVQALHQQQHAAGCKMPAAAISRGFLSGRNLAPERASGQAPNQVLDDVLDHA